MTPDMLAEARRALAEVQAALQTATEKSAAIRDRLTAAHARQAEITASRIAGTVNPADVAEYAVLGGDIGALDKMLADAEASVAAANPHPAKEHLRQVEKAYEREAAQTEFDALTTRATKLDEALCNCVRDLHAAGMKAGRQPSLVMSWTPSKALADAIKNGRTP